MFGAGNLLPLMALVPSLNMLVRVFDHHHRRVDHRADRDGDPAQRHDVSVDPLKPHYEEREHDAERQGEHRHQGRSHMPQEQRANDGNDDEFFDQLFGEIVDRAVDQRGPIVDCHHLNAGGQAFLQAGDPRFHRRDRVACIFSGAQDNDAASDLALAVEFGDAAADLGADLDTRDVTKLHRHTACGGAQRDGAKIGQFF